MPLDQILGAGGAALETSIVTRADGTAKVERAEVFLGERLPALDPGCVEAKETVDVIRAERGIVQVHDIVNRLQISTHRLQRFFSRYVGVSPKWVIQRFRMQEAAAQLAAGNADGARLALELGNGDQAHFMRDFKAMVGGAPGAFVRTTQKTDSRRGGNG